ncbi:MAG: hypothetical protein AAFY71_03640 [Bacteroidota bacterium]
MKKLYILIVLTLLHMDYSWAQNPLFVDFRTEPTMLKEKIKENKGVRFLDSDFKHSITAQWRKGEFVYSFHRGQLFEISMEKVFETRKDGRIALEECQEFFSIMKAVQLEVLLDDKFKKEMVYTWEGKVLWLTYELLPGNRTALSIQSRYIAHTPLEMWTRFEEKVAQTYGMGQSIEIALSRGED